MSSLASPFPTSCISLVKGSDGTPAGTSIVLDLAPGTADGVLDKPFAFNDLVYFLARVGLIDAHDMLHSFKYSIVAMFVISAVITPPDVLSQLLMAGPLLLLYGVGVIIAWLVSTKKRDEPAPNGS